jgi:NACHT domain
MAAPSLRVLKEKLTEVQSALQRWGGQRKQLASETHVSIDVVRNFLNGEKIETDRFKSICQVLGLNWQDYADFIVDDPPPPPPFIYPLEFQALIAEKTKRFVGRKFVFDAIDNFLSRYDRGYFTLVGEPGQGKSAILAKYLSTSSEGKEFVIHFNIQEEGKNRASYFLESICSQLIERYKLKTDPPARAFENGIFFCQLLEKVSQQLRQYTKLVILVDALDEVDTASQNEDVNLLYLPKYLPLNVYFLLSRRPFIDYQEQLVTEAPHELFDLRIRENLELGISDIKEYIKLTLADPEYGDKLNQWINNQRDLSSEKFIGMLSEKSENNFIYVRYMLPDIANGHCKPLDMEDLPKGLEKYYIYQWQRMGMTAVPRPVLKLKVIYTLARLRVPVSVELVAQIVGATEVGVQEVLYEWEQFLKWVKNKEEADCCSIYHLSFTDFLYGKAKDLSVLNLEIFDKAIADYYTLELYGDG